MSEQGNSAFIIAKKMLWIDNVNIKVHSLSALDKRLHLISKEYPFDKGSPLLMSTISTKYLKIDNVIFL